MRKVLFILLIYIPLQGYGQIIADHTVVDKFDDIPQYYIDKVKKMWLSYAGESHSEAIRTGLVLLESIDSRFQVNVTESGTPEAYTSSYFRASRATWGDRSNSSGWIYSYGEEDWYKGSTAINRTKAGIDYCNTTGPVLNAFGLGWCWDPDEEADDMVTYLDVTQQYIDYCTTIGYPTKVFFTTGPVDGANATGEVGYNKYLAYEAIRDYVVLDETRILFDYADILCYDDDSETPNTTTWSGHEYPIITTTNSLPEQTGHISNAGALRLAKAMWWMLSRIAGWDGSSPLDIDDNQNNKGYSKKIVTHDKIELHLDEHYSKWSAGLYDFQGMEIIKKTIGSDLLTFNISTLSSGIYFIVLSNGREKLVEKVIKP